MPVPPRLLVLLLPSHGMEDLPDSPDEAEAEELLAAFACLAHPAAAQKITRPPMWDRADLPPALHAGDVVLVPSSCDVWMEPTWCEEQVAAGVTVIRGCQSVDEWFDAVGTAFAETNNASDETAVANAPFSNDAKIAFLGVGLTRLFLERLARRLHNFDGIDETRWHEAIRSAAVAISDGADVREAIAPCYDPLLEYRDQLQPIDPAILDVVMFGPVVQDNATSEGDTAEPLGEILGDAHDGPVNLMADRPTWLTVLEARPELADRVRDMWPEHDVDLLLGEDEDCETRLEPVSVTAARLQSVRQWSIDTFGRPPKIWARRDYGLHPDLPMLLRSAGYDGALHLTFDVGPYPEREEAKLTWQSLDGTGIEAFSRLPVPAGRAATFWQLPEHLGESIEADCTAAVMLVRWADTDPWWAKAFRSATSIAPVCGRLKTFSQFLTDAESYGTVLKPTANEYGSAALAKRAALSAENPTDQERARWRAEIEPTVADLVRGFACFLGAVSESDGANNTPFGPLASAIAGPGETDGTLVFNPTPRQRTARVDVANGQTWVSVPAYGYAWCGDDHSPATGPSLVEEGRLRNEFLEVSIHETTGGIQRLAVPGRRGNYLSQHLSRRLGEDVYLKATADSIEVVENTPVSAAIRSQGTFPVSDHEDAFVVSFTQTFRVVRGQPAVEVTIELDGPVPAEGNPWQFYDACRFAWSTESAAVSQSCDLVPTISARDRIESPLFFEIDDDKTVTLVTHGSSFHRRDGRTLDTLLRVAGDDESPSPFRFTIGFGPQDPAGLTLAAMTPEQPYQLRTSCPRVPSAWLASFDRVGVVLLRFDQEAAPDGTVVFVARVRETNGVAGVVTFRLCRPVAEAMARDLSGRMTDRLLIRDGAVEIRLRAFQMRDIVLMPA